MHIFFLLSPKEHSRKIFKNPLGNSTFSPRARASFQHPYPCPSSTWPDLWPIPLQNILSWLPCPVNSLYSNYPVFCCQINIGETHFPWSITNISICQSMFAALNLIGKAGSSIKPATSESCGHWASDHSQLMDTWRFPVPTLHCGDLCACSTPFNRQHKTVFCLDEWKLNTKTTVTKKLRIIKKILKADKRDIGTKHGK